MSWISVKDKRPVTTENLPRVPGILTTSPGGRLTERLEDFNRRSSDGDVLRIMSPVVDDEVIVRLLVEARQRGVTVRLLTTLSDRHGIKTKGWDASQSIDRHNECIRVLAKAGVILRSPATTPHGKMVIRNSNDAFFGSANLATGSLRGHALEAALLFEKAAFVELLAECFDNIWKASPFRMRHKAGAVILEEGTAEPLVNTDNAAGAISDDLGVWMSGPACPAGTRRLVNLIRQATSEVLLVALSLYETDRIPDLHQALLDALGRKVKVRAIIRQEHFRKEEEEGKYPDPATMQLLKNGMEIYGQPGLHAKGLVVDESWSTIQSANFNPFSLDSGIPECNVEIVVSGSTSQTGLGAYANWMRQLASGASHQLVL